MRDKRRFHAWQILSILLFPGNGPATVLNVHASEAFILCASAGFVREIAEHVYNVARISRMLPRYSDGRYAPLRIYTIQLETRHLDDTFHANI